MGLIDDIKEKKSYYEFKKYLEGRNVGYDVDEKNKIIYFKQNLENKFKSLDVEVNFVGDKVTVNFIIVRSTSIKYIQEIKEKIGQLREVAEKHMSQRYQKNYKKNGNIDFIYTMYANGEVCLTYESNYGNFDGTREDFIRECLDVPVDILNFYGDEIYEFFQDKAGDLCTSIVVSGSDPEDRRRDESRAPESGKESRSARWAAMEGKEGESDSARKEEKEILALPPSSEESQDSEDEYDDDDDHEKSDPRKEECLDRKVIGAFMGYLDRESISYTMSFDKSKGRKIEVRHDFRRKFGTTTLTFRCYDDRSIAVTGVLGHAEPGANMKDIGIIIEVLNYTSNISYKKDEEKIYYLSEDGDATFEFLYKFEDPNRISDNVFFKCLHGTMDYLNADLYLDRLTDALHGGGDGSHPDQEPAPGAPKDSGHGEDSPKPVESKESPAKRALVLVWKILDKRKGCYVDPKFHSNYISVEIFNIDFIIVRASFYFKEKGVLTICELSVAPLKNRAEIVNILNNMNVDLQANGTYEMDPKSGMVRYRTYVEYGKNGEFSPDDARKVVKDSIAAWSKVPWSFIKLL